MELWGGFFILVPEIEKKKGFADNNEAGAGMMRVMVWGGCQTGMSKDKMQKSRVD